MRKNKKHVFYILILWFAIISNSLLAQTADSVFADFNFAKNSQAWLNSNNATGLHHFQLSHASTISLSFNKQKGGFVNYYQSDNSNVWSGKTESYYRLNNKIVFYGLVNYKNFMGKNMGGSIFLNPNETPFNILETADSTAGNKKQENYQLIGAISFAIKPNLYLGTKINYQATNYAKHKDLRHKNKALNLKLTAGISYKLKSLEIGANYLYNRYIEGIQLDMFGNTDKQYMLLIDFGNFYGRRELYDDNGIGYISGYGEKPLSNISNGGNLQIDIILSDKLTFFNEFGFNKSKGNFGIKEMGSILYTSHKGYNLSYTGVLSYQQQNRLHKLKLNFANSNLTNYENIFRISTNPGELSKTEYFGEVKMLNRKLLQTSINYTGYFCIKNLKPKWELQAGVNIFNRNQKTSIFPFYRKQNISNLIAQASLMRTFFYTNKQLSVQANIGYGKGTGTPFTDTHRGTLSTITKKPKSSELNIYREHEFYTLSRMIAGINAKYGLYLKNKLFAYKKLSYQLTYAPNTQYIKGKYLHYLQIKIGIEF